MKRDGMIQVIAAGVMILFLLISAALTPAVAASAGRHRLVHASVAEEGTPPQVALGIAMGAFRGLFVNFLWIRANSMKEEGKYFEAVDLAGTITKLQPRFPRVWTFHAWNLAYNISVATQTPQERWNWVSQGINLLRSEGIPANPNSVLLYKEISWIFVHKVQGYMDDAHHYYKREHALEWTIALGQPEFVPMGEDPIEARLAQLEEIRNAFDNTAEVIDNVEGGSQALAMLQQRGIGLDDTFLYMYEYVKSLGVASAAIGFGVGPSDLDRELAAAITDPVVGEGFAQLAAMIRKRALRDAYHMRIDKMIEYTRKFGPIDWRHPAGHALYWSTLGVDESRLRVNEINKKDHDFLNTDRMSIHSIQSLFRTGRLQYDIINPDFYLALPEIAYIDKYREKMDEVSERNVVYDNDGKAVDMRGRTYNYYGSGYENFMKDAVRYIYRQGDAARATRMLDDLRSFEGANVHQPDRADQYAVTLEEFVATEVAGDRRFTNPTVAMQEVQGSLDGAFTSLLSGDMKGFRSQYVYAKEFHTVFMSNQFFKTNVNQEDRARLELMPRDFQVMAGSQLARMLDMLGGAKGAQLYARTALLPDDLQRAAYYFFEQNPRFKQSKAEIDQDGVSLADRFFPEPPQMDEMRVIMAAKVRMERENRAQTDLK